MDIRINIGQANIDIEEQNNTIAFINCICNKDMLGAYNIFKNNKKIYVNAVIVSINNHSISMPLSNYVFYKGNIALLKFILEDERLDYSLRDSWKGKNIVELIRESEEKRTVLKEKGIFEIEDELNQDNFDLEQSKFKGLSIF